VNEEAMAHWGAVASKEKKKARMRSKNFKEAKREKSQVKM